jgi:hypothetical protein
MQSLFAKRLAACFTARHRHALLYAKSHKITNVLKSQPFFSSTFLFFQPQTNLFFRLFSISLMLCIYALFNRKNMCLPDIFNFLSMYKVSTYSAAFTNGRLPNFPKQTKPASDRRPGCRRPSRLCLLIATE